MAWFYNTQAPNWSNTSLEMYSIDALNTYGSWVQLPDNITTSLTLDGATIHLSKDTFNPNLRWFKYVDTKLTYYYFVADYSMSANNYIVQLTLDLKSTYLSPLFTNQPSDNDDVPVRFVQHHIGAKHYNDLLNNMGADYFIKNLYNTHTNLSQETSTCYNNFQGNLFYANLGEALQFFDENAYEIYPEQN